MDNVSNSFDVLNDWKEFKNAVSNSFDFNLCLDHLGFLVIGLILALLVIQMIIIVVRCLCGQRKVAAEKTVDRLISIYHGDASVGLRKPPQSILDMAKLSFRPSYTELIIRFVSKNNYDINCSCTSDGLNLFMCSCIGGEPALIKFLLMNGGNLHQRAVGGNSVLYLATFGILNLAEIRNSGLHSADIKDGVKTLEMLIDAGADVDACNEIGFTSLHLAISYRNIEIVRCLLRRNASAFVTSKSGITPMLLAVSTGFTEAIQLIQRFSRED